MRENLGGIRRRGKIFAAAMLMTAVVGFTFAFIVRADAPARGGAAFAAGESYGGAVYGDAVPDGVTPVELADDADYIHIGEYVSAIHNSFGAKITTDGGAGMDVPGIFVRRMADQALSPETVYYCSVYPVMREDPANPNSALVIIDETLETRPDIVQNFLHAEFVPVKRVDNEWQTMENDENGDFWIEVSDPRTAVVWYLRQTAALGSYGILFTNDKGTMSVDDDESYVYQVVHTGDWTYVSADSDLMTDNTKTIRNFSGGPFVTLRLQMSYNEGAMVATGREEKLLPNGATVGDVWPELLVNTEMWNMNENDHNSMGEATYRLTNNSNVTVSDIDGNAYNNLYVAINGVERNVLELTFHEPLQDNKVYVIKFGSSQDKYVYGTLIIDNTVTGGVNLSTLWKFFVFFGAGLAILVSILYFVPVIVRRRNEVKVFRENERIQREKMGAKEAVGGKSGGDGKNGKKKKKGGLGQALHDFGAKWKGTYAAEQEKKKAEEEKLRLEAGITEDEPKRRDANGHSRFTDTIREKRERRQAAMQQGLTEDDLKRMEDSVHRLKQAKEDSFVHLREDTPIAKYKNKKILNNADDITQNQTLSGGAIFTPIEGAPAEAQAGAGTPAAGTEGAGAPADGTGTPPAAPALPDNSEVVQSGGAVFIPLSEGAPVEYVPEEYAESDGEDPQNPNG